MKRIFTIIFTALVAITACQDPVEEQQKQELNQNLAFTLDVASVDAEMAKIRVSHNGTNGDTWYGFVTEEVKTSDAKLISQKIEELKAGDLKSALNSSAATTVTLRDLKPMTSYKYLAFGLSESGEIYGLSSSVEFKTVQGKVVMKENKAWKVVYTGKGTINNQEYEPTVTVNSSDLNTYFITAYSVETFEEYGIETIAEYELEYLKEYIKAINQEKGSNLTIGQMLFKGTGTDALNLTPGDWYAIAIGADDLGNLTGHYAISDVITIAEEEATPAYAEWIGDWTVTGSNGISMDVTFHKGINNLYYYLSGWEDQNDLGIAVDWDKENEIWAIYTQSLGVYEFDGGTQGEIFAIGAEASGNFYPIEGLPICVGGVEEDGSRTAYGYVEELEDGSKFIVDHMQFAAHFGNNQWGYITGWFETGFPSFPMTFTKKTTASTASVSAVKPYKSVQTFANAPRAAKKVCKMIER